MQELFFSNPQNRILDIHKLYSKEGVCNIGIKLRFCGEYGEEDVLAILKTFFDNIPILKLRMNKDYKPYLSNCDANLSKWEKGKNPDVSELREWVSSPFECCDSFLYEIKYSVFEEYIDVYMKVHHIVVDSYSVAMGVHKLKELLDDRINGKKIEFPADKRAVESMLIPPQAKETSIEWFWEKYNSTVGENNSEYAVQYGKLDAERFSFNLPQNVYKEVKNLEKQKGYSIEVQFSAILSVYFSACNMSDMFCFGRTVLNRTKSDKDFIIMKANTLPVFLNLDSFQAFEDICKYLRKYFFGMYRHADLSQKYIENRINSSGALYNQMISYRQLNMIPSVDGVVQEEIWNNKSELPVKWYIDEYDNQIRIDVQYQTALFNREKIDNIISRLMLLFLQLFANEPLKNVCFITKKDREIINKTVTESPHDYGKLLPQLILAQIECTPNAIAYKSENRFLTYQELGVKSLQVAGWLDAMGTKKGDIVGVCLSASIDVPYVFLGIWRAGAAFLPISPRESEERKKELIKYCKICIQEKDIEHIGKHSDFNNAKLSDDDIAYYMCTSGSSGMSKIVKISFDALTRRIFWMNDMWNCSRNVLQNASYTFDVSIWQYFLPVSYGGVAFILKDEDRYNPKKITDIIKDHSITTIHFIPTMLSVWVEYLEKNKIDLSNVKDVFSSGEVLSSDLVNRIYKALPKCRVHNLYGPTECTIDVSWHDCEKNEKIVPIGRSAYWTEFKVLDHIDRELPPGEKGELSIHGKLVGKGYLGDYTGGFYTDSNGEEAYKTGDVVLVSTDGELEFYGRSDDQKKINGMRIDLAQIDSLVREFPGIIQCCTIIKNKQIVCFYMSENKLSGIREYLLDKLPYYSMPNRFIFCKNIPLTNNGKLDKKYLENHLLEHKAKYKSKKEKYICELIYKKTGISISPKINIFLEGVDSISLIEIIYELEKKGMIFTPEDFYTAGTVRRLLEKQNAGYYWLKKDNEDNLVVAFPYAAGSPKDFNYLAKNLKNKNVDFIVAHSYNSLPDLDEYKKIVVLGYCTGSANAMGMIATNKDNLTGAVICAVTPPGYAGRVVGSPWKFFTDEMLNRFLKTLRGDYIDLKKGMLKTFRKDADYFYEMFNTKDFLTDIPLRIVLGERDPLTFPNAISKNKWKKYFKGSIKTSILENRGHYFIKEESVYISKCILEMLN